MTAALPRWSVGVAVVLLGCAHPNARRPELVLKFCHQATESDIWHKAAVYFAHAVDSLSEGRIRVEVFPAEQLGSERDMIRSIEAGLADMTTTGETLQNWSPIAAFCSIPYLIQDSSQLRRVVEGPVGQEIKETLIRDVGLRPLAYFKRGARHLTSNRPIRTPADLKGIILRVPNVPISVKTWEALGAKPTPMAFSEVFTALQQGTVEAEENPFALICSAGFYEVQKYVDLTGHVYGWVYVVIGEKQFEAMSPAFRQILLQAAAAMQAYHDRLFDRQEALLRTQLESHGMQFVQADVAAFSRMAAPAVVQSLPLSLRPLYYKIKETENGP